MRGEISGPAREWRSLKRVLSRDVEIRISRALFGNVRNLLPQQLVRAVRFCLDIVHLDARLECITLRLPLASRVESNQDCAITTRNCDSSLMAQPEARLLLFWPNVRSVQRRAVPKRPLSLLKAPPLVGNQRDEPELGRPGTATPLRAAHLGVAFSSR